MIKRSFYRWLFLVMAITLVPAACTRDRETQKERGASAKPVIKLAENPWLSARLNNAVAKILLEEKMGYPVEVAAFDGYTQFPALAKGETHASLEVWPSGRAEYIHEYIKEKRTVEHGGRLGPVGKVGWFIPSYMLDEHPELATWEGFKDQDKTALFRTPESGDKGQFLAGDPSWIQHDADIIRNLGLDLQVVRVGSEEAILDALDVAYSKKKPILFYFWTPHSALSRYKLTQVKLPECSKESYSKADKGSVDCEYPPDEMTKIFWVPFKDYAPEAYQFLKNFCYTNLDQISMLAEVDIRGKTVEDAARFWIEQNENVWSRWIPKKH